jgi:hypothetical protein
MVDNLWPVCLSLILPQVVQEFSAEGEYLNLAQNLGLTVGSMVWGLSSDIWGRK